MAGPDLSREEWDRLDALLDEALDRTGPERQAWLEGLDEADRRQVEDLLSHLGDDHHPVDHALRLTGGVEPGTTIGRWRLGPILGEGGSSTVFAATHTDDELELHAALKLLRPGPDAHRFRRRFRQERNILLDLRHPHIVRLLDGGTAGNGAPFYVMERITGPDLLHWCRDRPLPTRLRCLVDICRAVDHAHRRLVVHCDLKPENIVVDEDGAPRVLDFGIAQLVDGSHVTQTQRMLTPRWAAPEQVDGTPLTTATDVHALGLLLWALITDRTPRADLTGTALLADIGRAPLPPPSTLVASTSGDLDAIHARATALDPADRYRSAADLADDLERHLRGDAVQARVGRLYRISRWARRHRFAVATAVLVSGLLVGWAVSSSWQSARLAQQRDLAARQAERAEQTLDLLVGLLEAADPAQARGTELTVREVLDQAARRLELESTDPVLKGEVLAAVGRVQMANGDLLPALHSLQTAHRLLVEHRGPEAPATLRVTRHLARIEYILRDHPEVDLPPGAGEARLVDLLTVLERLDADGLGEARMLQAEILADRQAWSDARSLAAGAARRLAAEGAPRRAARATAIEGYAALHLDDLEGRQLMRRSLDQLEDILGTRVHPDYADILHEFTLVAPPEDKPALARQSVELRRQLNGESWNLAAALNNLGLTIEATDLEGAIVAYREAVRIADDSPQAQSASAVSMRLHLAEALIMAGRAEEAGPVLQHVVNTPSVRTDQRDKALDFQRQVQPSLQ